MTQPALTSLPPCAEPSADVAPWPAVTVPWPSPRVGVVSLRLPPGFARAPVTDLAPDMLTPSERALGVWYGPAVETPGPHAWPATISLSITSRPGMPTVGFPKQPAVIAADECQLQTAAWRWHVRGLRVSDPALGGGEYVLAWCEVESGVYLQFLGAARTAGEVALIRASLTSVVRSAA